MGLCEACCRLHSQRLEPWLALQMSLCDREADLDALEVSPA